MNGEVAGKIPEKALQDLPEEAQELFKDTFVKAWLGFKSTENIKGLSHERVRFQSAMDTAWIAVNKEYEHKNCTWMKKEDG